MPSKTLRSGVLFSTRNLRRMQILSPILAILLFTASSGAQQTQQSPQAQQGPPRPDAPPAEQASPQEQAQSPAPVTLPAGTQLALILTHSINSKTMRRGDTVFAETTAPVFAKWRNSRGKAAGQSC